MAIIRCPECGGKLSDRAKVCVHCGYPLSEMQQAEYEDQTGSRSEAEYKNGYLSAIVAALTVPVAGVVTAGLGYTGVFTGLCLNRSKD